MLSTSAGSRRMEFSAIYYDGKTANRYEVSVVFLSDRLDVFGADGGLLDSWRHDQIELSDQGSGGARVIKQGTEARLVFADGDAFDVLRANAPAVMSLQQRSRKNMLYAVGVTVVTVLGFYLAIPLLASGIVSMISFETEKSIGHAVSRDFAVFFANEEDTGKCRAGPGHDALARMVDHLAAQTSGPFDYDIKVLDNDMVNAMAFPGGYIFVFRGLIDEAESADEVAGVIAHEMAHVDHRHGMQAVVRGYGLGLLADMMFGGGTMGSVSQVAMSMSYSRDAEHAADVAGLQTLARAGVDTDGFARFFERLHEKEAESRWSLPAFISTHPATGRREQLIREYSGAGTWSLSDEEWAALKKICD